MFSTLHKMMTANGMTLLSMKKTLVTVFCVLFGLGSAWAAKEDNLTLKVTVYGSDHGKVAVSSYNNDNIPTTGSASASVTIKSKNRADKNWANVNYAWIVAIPNTGYKFVGWAAKAQDVATKTLASTDAVELRKQALGSGRQMYKLDANPGTTDNGITKTKVLYRVDDVLWTSNRNDEIAYYAIFAPETYTVSFDANATDVTNPQGITVTYDAAYGTLPTVSRTGYTFDGWYTAATGGTKIEATTTVAITAAQTLYAHWTANTYTVSFDANATDVTNPQDITVTYDAAYGTLPTPTREAYVFAGWWTAAEGGTEVTALSTVDITDNQTLYAQWQKKMMFIQGNNVPETNDYITTFYDSKYAYTIPTGVTAYTAVQNNDVFDLTPIKSGVLAKGEAVVFVTKENAGQITLEATAEDATKEEKNELIGVDEDTPVAGLTTYSDIFILSYTPDNGLGFYLLTGDYLVGNKAFFGATSASDAKNFGFRFLDRGTTGINSVATETTGIRKFAGANGIVIEKDGKQFNVAGGRIK